MILLSLISGAAEAELGYKYSVDRASDLRVAAEHGQGHVRRARTHKIEIMIHNLVSSFLSTGCMTILLTIQLRNLPSSQLQRPRSRNTGS